ncbi:MAG TPA: 1-acyl-sn-glycerol-3-phosphate acyltransferase [Solirubrobacterales bacterium]|nr:1-acyl-sn-glycerol-3-phosphate acyltransferase [Solirubrobacterales bacterium]
MTSPPSSPESRPSPGYEPGYEPGREPGLSPRELERYHRYTREHGVNWPMYLLARVVLTPFFLIWFRLSRSGRPNAAGIEGGLIVAANHRSFLDPFVIGVGLPWSRPMNYVAKMELFRRPWQGWLLSRLGAFPIRRGEADEEAMRTARMVAERGGTVCIFPEGTRIRRGSLSTPKRGVGRLALQTGAAVVPVAVHGTEWVRRGWRIRPRKVIVRLGVASIYPRTENPSPALAATVTGRIWPSVQLQWEEIGGLPPVRRAAVIGAGSWGTAIAVLLARGGLEVQLGTRDQARAAEIARTRINERYLEGVRLPEAVEVRAMEEIELGAVDLVCLAVPSKALASVVAWLGPRLGKRAAVLLLSKGLVAPVGELPTLYVEEEVEARAVACLGGPAHAREAISGSAALVLGSRDPNLRAQLGEVFDAAGLVCERSADVVGVEVAGAAKNAAAMAAAVAEPHGLNAAGIAATAIWLECLAYAIKLGASSETFAGLAGVGDLTATVLAPGSRNRRAGRMLGEGVPVAEIPGRVGQVSEAMDSVPLMAETVAAAGVSADGLAALAALVRGEITADAWLAGLRRLERSRRGT